MQFSEKFLYHIWDAQHLKDKLKTVSGKSVKIMFQGRWNTDAGPDFKDAIIDIKGKVRKGDVEIDRQTYDWISHNHNENTQFNKVILHVIYKHNGKYTFTINENGDKVEIFELKDFLDTDIAKLLKRYSNKVFKEKDKFCNFFTMISSDETGLILTKLGLERFEKKNKRFSAEHYFADFDQLILQGLFEALGYSKNKYQMLQLALRFPFSKLKEFHKKGLSKDELITIWLCSTDLINNLPATFPTELKTKWQEMYNKQKYTSDFLDINWQLFRIRPVNHPAIRILQIVDLIYDNFESSLFNNILRLFSFKADTFNIKDFTKKLYSTFQTKSDFIPEKYTLGKTRIDTILINIILPLVVIYSREKSYKELEHAAMKVYKEFHGLPENYITQYMSKFMNAPQKNLFKKKAILQQGVLKLYFDNCQHHACNDCEELIGKKENLC